MVDSSASQQREELMEMLILRSQNASIRTKPNIDGTSCDPNTNMEVEKAGSTENRRVPGQSSNAVHELWLLTGCWP
jgi:hypothetical protein